MHGSRRAQPADERAADREIDKAAALLVGGPLDQGGVRRGGPARDRARAQADGAAEVDLALVETARAAATGATRSPTSNTARAYVPV